ncbi:hypothetical protein B7Z17_03230, partial [Candidatus Saccharibacteria bacterium 32-49-10]
MKQLDTEGFELQPDRYRTIDTYNRESYLFYEEPLFRVLQSLHSVGPPREKYPARKIGRRLLAGNMSGGPLYGPSSLTEEERRVQASGNVDAFLLDHHFEKSQVRMLNPERNYETPLTSLFVEEASCTNDAGGVPRFERASDLLYTYDASVALAARPADCPIVFLSATTPQGELFSLLHLSWLGVAHDYIAQAKQQYDSLGVEWGSARMYVTPGGHSETFIFTEFEDYDPLQRYPAHADMFKHVVPSRRKN